MKIVSCDSSSLISLSNTCLLWLLEKLPIKFVVPKKVFVETVSRPLGIKRYEYWARTIKKFVDKGAIKVEETSEELARKILYLSNSLFFLRGKPLKIVHEGEAYALALALEKGDAYMVDERTMREIIEDPYTLKAYLQERMGEKIKVNKNTLQEIYDLFGDFPVLRSSEIVAMAYDLDIVDWNPEYFKATLYALKYSGCAITPEEIEEYGRML